MMNIIGLMCAIGFIPPEDSRGPLSRSAARASIGLLALIVTAFGRVNPSGVIVGGAALGFAGQALSRGR